jgi:hypothetical protein
MKLLLLNYKLNAYKLLGKTIQQPKISDKYKQKFVKLNDPVTDFYDSYISYVDNSENFVQFSDIMDCYRDYCKSNNYRIQNKKELMENIKNIHGKENFKTNKYQRRAGEKLIHHRNVFLKMKLNNLENNGDEINIKNGAKIDIIGDNGQVIGQEIYNKN